MSYYCHLIPRILSYCALLFLLTLLSVNSIPTSEALTSDEIIKLKEAGVSDKAYAVEYEWTWRIYAYGAHLKVGFK